MKKVGFVRKIQKERGLKEAIKNPVKIRVLFLQGTYV